MKLIMHKTRRDRIRSEEIRKIIGVTSVRSKTEKSQLSWLGQLERMDEERIAKQRWNWIPEGTRPMGRPRKRWKDGVNEILASNGIANIEELREEDAFERTNWKRVLTQLTG